MRWTACIVGAVLCALGATARIAQADRVIMTDGTVHQGLIVVETDAAIVLDTMVNGERTKITIDPYDVKNVERKPLPRGFFGADDPAPAQAPQSAPTNAKDTNKDSTRPQRTPANNRSTNRPKGITDGTYAVIPIEGVFGEDISPVGVREALELAKRRSIRHIVFDIDSPGGYTWAADRIVEVLAEFDEDFDYHAHIRNAFSASIWVVFSCDTITMAPGSSVGAAVTFAQTETGVEAVDAKFTSARISTLRNLAKAKGHADALIAPMMDMPAQLYAWRDADGQPVVSNDPPSGNPIGLRHLDNESQVLTLTVDDAIDIGLATQVQGGHRALGEQLAIDGWNHLPNLCERPMAQRGKELRKLVDTVDQGLPKLRELIEKAVAEHPSNVQVTYYTESGLLTPGSQQKWRDQTDIALRAWNDVFEAFRGLDLLTSQFEKVGGIERFPRQELQEIGVRVDEEIRNLRANRMRTHY
ncbi:MAG: hypothetical protein KDA20_01535 [Phycisphaerales bacterium]|nr:hypothetical protein [Phycisphaerales bacterium]